MLLVVTILGVISTEAQLKLPKAGSAGANIGSLLSQFTDGLKPTSFLDSWASGGKTNWLATAAKVTTGSGLGSSIASLAGFIKPNLFKGGFNVANLVKTANTIKTLSGAAGLLKNLEGGLKPEAFTDAWSSQRPAWLSALSLVK